VCIADITANGFYVDRDSKDTQKESDGGYYTEEDPEATDDARTQRWRSRVRQNNLCPRVRRANTECQRSSNEVDHKHGVHLSTNHSAASRSPNTMHCLP